MVENPPNCAVIHPSAPAIQHRANDIDHAVGIVVEVAARYAHNGPPGK
jgi:hypothetical protein